MAKTLESPRDLMIQMLGEMLYVERAQAGEVLPQLAKEVHDDELRSGLEEHAQQTREQTSSLEHAFELLGAAPKPQPNPAFDGLRKSHDRIIDAIEMDQLRDAFDASAAAKAEHLEIASYHSLIAMSEQMGQPELTKTLKKVAGQEEQMARRLDQVSQRIGKSLAA